MNDKLNVAFDVVVQYFHRYLSVSLISTIKMGVYVLRSISSLFIVIRLDFKLDSVRMISQLNGCFTVTHTNSLFNLFATFELSTAIMIYGHKLLNKIPHPVAIIYCYAVHWIILYDSSRLEFIHFCKRLPALKHLIWVNFIKMIFENLAKTPIVLL